MDVDIVEMSRNLWQTQVVISGVEKYFRSSVTSFFSFNL